MASTARHRANPSLRSWAAHGIVAATTVPVGALAGCVVAAVATTAQSPGLGVTGLAVAGVPLTLHGLRSRRAARRARVRGRHAAGVEQLLPARSSATTGALPSDLTSDLPVVRLDPAVDPGEPSPAAASALALVPVAAAQTRARDEAGAEPLAVVVALPSPRTPEDDAVVEAVAAAVEVRPEVVVRVGLDTGEVSVRVEQPTTVAPEQRAAEIAQLNRLWASGTGPDTGSLRITAAA